MNEDFQKNNTKIFEKIIESLKLMGKAHEIQEKKNKNLIELTKNNQEYLLKLLEQISYLWKIFFLGFLFLVLFSLRTEILFISNFFWIRLKGYRKLGKQRFFKSCLVEFG